jgi:hypothetical protein
MNKVGEMAKEAYKKYPFYKWCYDKAGISPEELEQGKVPVIDKSAFFEYEDEKGVPYYYYKGLNMEDPDTFVARTTGTTGRPLEVLFTKYDLPMKTALETRFSDIIEREGELRTLYPGETSEHMLGIYGIQGNYEKQFFFPRGTLEKKLAYLKKARPHVVFDITTDVIRYLVKNEVNMAEYGLEYVIYLRMEPSLKEKLKKQVKLCSVFGAIDALMVAFGCPLDEERRHLYSPDAIYEVFTEDGEVQETGEGLLVSTFSLKGFPLIRYTNRDRVQIAESSCECGYTGRDLDFLGREHGVKVPTPEEVMIDYERVFEAFMEKPYTERVMTAFMDIEEDGIPENILATFIECDVEEPKLDEGMAVEVMWVGSGNVYERHLKYLPVIYVPNGTIPWSTLGRLKSYVKLTAGASEETRKLYEHFMDIVEKVTEWQIIR